MIIKWYGYTFWGGNFVKNVLPPKKGFTLEEKKLLPSDSKRREFVSLVESRE